MSASPPPYFPNLDWITPPKQLLLLSPSPSTRTTKSPPPKFPDLVIESPKMSPRRVILKGASLSICHYTVDTKPDVLLKSMEVQLNLILHQRTVAPWARQLIQELLIDCRHTQDAAISITAEELETRCIRLTGNCQFLAEKLRIDEALERSIEEYQVMRFHNYLLEMGNAIPETQKIGKAFIDSLPENSMRYDGGRWKFVFMAIEREVRLLVEWKDMNSGASKPKTPVLDSIQKAATQCRNFSWEYFYSPLAEYVERCRPESERKNTIALPGEKRYVQTESLEQLVTAGRWEEVACILVRNFHDLPNMVPLALGRKIEMFQEELRRFRDWHFKSIMEIWCRDEKRWIARSYEVHDWVVELEQMREASQMKDAKEEEKRKGALVDGETEAGWEEKEELKGEYLKAQLKWKRSHDDVEEAETEVKKAQDIFEQTKRVLEEEVRKAKRKLEERRVVLQMSRDVLLNIARKVETQE